MMKKRVLLLILGIIGFGLIAQLFLIPIVKKYNFRKQYQEPLADKLGIKIDDYSYQSVFPIGYFYVTLKQGMPLDEVHAIVRGYKKVYNCFGTDEIYYYFSDKDDEALRFEIRYDDQLKFETMRGEDENERTINIDPTCLNGLLDK